MDLIWKYATALLLAAALPAPAIAQSASESPAAETPASREITLFQSARRVLVMVRIDGGEMVPMVFDTGSDGNTIDLPLAQRLGLEKIGSVQEVDGSTGHTRMLPLIAARNLDVGGVPVARIDAAAVPYDRSDAMGIFSPETFTDNLLYLDLAHDRAVLTPRDAASAPAQAPIPYVDGLPTVHMVMPDGSSLPAHFDTGYDGALSLPMAMMESVPLMGPPEVVGRFKSISQEGEVYGGQIKGTIAIGPLVLENPHVVFLGDIANIGLPIIRQLTLVIDAQADRNWVLAAGSAPELR